MDLKGKRVTILGAGRSGTAVVKLVAQLQGIPKISDNSPQINFPDDFKEWMQKHPVAVESNGHTPGFIQESDLVVISPGVRIDAPPIQWAGEKKIPVWGEIEFAYRFCHKPIIAVTGSNGKTTTATLISEVLARAGKRPCLCGNVGSPFSQYVLDLAAKDYVVLEISSFQLESILDFKPHIAVFLNFNKNHLDRHKDMEEYFAAKQRIFMNQDKNDFAVLNARDPYVAKLASQVVSQVVYFNKERSAPGAAAHNPNHAAVVAVAGILGIDGKICQEVFANFKGVEHRMEWVRTLNGVDFVNDSKSTTAEAGRWAMENIKKPIVMICGGRDKNIDFTVLQDLVKKKVKKVYVIGEAKEKIKKSFAAVVPVEECEGLEVAVQRAQANAAPGDCVLLSPMCASFDMFLNFEERGKIFKSIVNKL